MLTITAASNPSRSVMKNAAAILFLPVSAVWSGAGQVPSSHSRSVYSPALHQPEPQEAGRLKMGNDLYTPVGMKGWYHAIFRRESDGAEKLLTIDQLLRKMNDWT